MEINNTTAPKKKEKTVKIRIPITRDENGDVFVSINERTWLIQRGVEVEVPECVAKLLRRQEEAREAAIKFENGIAKNV